MSRLHTKWHRFLHHTYPTSGALDSAHDPIASPTAPFKGDFALDGALTVNAPLSAYAAYFNSNNTAISAVTLTEPNSASGRAGYFYAPALSAGPFAVFDDVRALWPKALIIDGYADFLWPVYMPVLGVYTIQAQDVFVNYLESVDTVTANLTAENALITNLTVLNTSVTYISATEIYYSVLTATEFLSPSARIEDLTWDAYGAILTMLPSASEVSYDANTWSLVPLASAQWDPFIYITGAGTVLPTKAGVYMCEMNTFARVLSGSNSGILAGVTTQTVMSPSFTDSTGGIFGGNWFTGNGITYTNTEGTSGVLLQGSTFVKVDGVSDEIGLYIYNSNSSININSARLRVIYLGNIL